MPERLLRRGMVVLIAAALAACGGSGGGSGGGPGAASGRVSGLVVVQPDVAAHDPAALGTAPADWADGAVAGKAALAHADWTLAAQGRSGTTADDGSFAIEGLAPGRYVLEVSRTLAGDLIATSLPFAVGDDGGAVVLGEIAWGAARTTSSFRDAGRALQEISAPGAVRVVLADGKPIELGDGTRTWRDVDGDGQLDTCTVDATGDGCAVVQIDALLTQQPERIHVGERAAAEAMLALSDGSTLDVSALVEWRSSDESVATIDRFGGLTGLAPGSTQIQATLGDLGSSPATLAVDARAALVHLQLQNASCFYPYGVDGPLPQPVQPLPLQPSDGGVWAPFCRQVIQIGDTISFIAVGEFADGEFQDVTAEVTWSFAPPSVASVASGVVTGVAAGTGQLTASLDGVASDPTDLTVVTEPTLLSLVVYTDDGGIGFHPPAAADAAQPCTGCAGFAVTALRGDTVALHVNGAYDTGAWRDLTLEASWTSSTPAVATIGPDGKLLARSAGTSSVTASLGAIASDPAQITVVDHATLESLYVSYAGDRVVARGDQRFFTAIGGYDLGFSRDVTSEASWHTGDASIARFDQPGVLTGVAAGDVEVWAEVDGIESTRLTLEVFQTSELDYCDPANVNRGTWTDGSDRVVLESDCATYTQPGVAQLRFTVTETSSPGGVFNPCLDLYVFQGRTPIRTIRQQGCGTPFVPPSSAGLDAAILKYQLRAFWDLKDDHGQPVPAGSYQIYGRFYLYYDPVVSLTVTIE